MTSPAPRTRSPLAPSVRAAWLLPLLSLGLYGCTAGLSCSGQGAGACINAYPYPQSTLENGVAPVDDGLRLRLTQAGLDFLQANLKTILIGAFGPDPSDPDLVRIEVDDIVDLGSGITLGGIENGESYPTALLLPVNALADQLRFEFIQGARDGLRARVQNLVVGLDARVFGAYDVGGLFTATAACDVDGTANNLCPSDAPGCQALTTVSFDVYLYPDVGQGTQCLVTTGECFRIDVDVRDVSLGSISSNSLEISVPPTCQSGSATCSPECSDGPDRDLECTVACVAVDFVADIVAGISGALLGVLEPFLATVVEQAVREALSEFDGAPLSISDTLDLAELSEDLISESAHPLGYAIAPTGNAFDVNCVSGTSCAEATGMDLLLTSGAEASPPDADDDDAVSLPHPCVVPLTGAAFAAFYEGSGEFRAPDALPLSGEFEGEPYHIGLSLARAAANQSLFATYNSGAMCLQIDSEQVHVLTEGAFPLSAGTLDLLTEGRLRQFAPPTAPAIVTVMPQEPPTVRFGAGDETEGLVQASWNHVEVSFYVLVYERFVRVFAVDADISASLSVYVDTTSETLRVAVADGPSIEGFNPTYNELLPDVAFDDVLESLVSLAFDSFLGDDLGFGFDVAGALEDALGVPLYIDFRGIEAVPSTGSREFLNVYLALSDTPLAPLRSRLPVDGLRLLEDRARAVVGPRGAVPSPPAEVRVIGVSTRLAPTHEFFVQIDHGAWRGPLRPGDDGVLVVQDAKLRLVGTHHVRFRVRHAGAPTTLSDVDGALRLVTDPVAPWVSLELESGAVVARGGDVGTVPSRLRYSWRSDDGEWSAPATVGSLSLASLDGVRRISVRAHDDADNSSRPYTLDLATTRVTRERDVPAAPTLLPSAGGCRTTSQGDLGPLLLVASVFLWRRQRRLIASDRHRPSR